MPFDMDEPQDMQQSGLELSPDQEKQFAQALADNEGHGDPNRVREKYSSHTELATAYAGLERKPGKEDANHPEGGDPVSTEEQPKADPGDVQQEKAAAMEKQAKDALKVGGLDITEFSDEYAEKGELSADSFKKLEDAGFPRAVVDQYIAGQQALAKAGMVVAEQEIAKIQNSVGGKQSYSQLMNWASKNLPQNEIDGFEAVVATNDPSAIQMAVYGVKAKYDAAYGVDPQLVRGKASSSEANDVYRSVEEVKAAMRDKRYSTDPAYRAEVAKKLSRSNVLRTDRR